LTITQTKRFPNRFIELGNEKRLTKT
jgi:hypothetical protein